MKTKSVYYLFFVLLLAGCGGSNTVPTTHLDARGIGGTNQVIAEMQSARDRLVQATIDLLNNGLPANLCAQYAEESDPLRAVLASLTSTQLGALRTDWFSTSELTDWQAALYRAKISADENFPSSDEVRIEGDNVIFRVSAFPDSTAVDIELYAMARAAQHLRGLPAGGSANGFASREEAIEAASACLAARLY